MGLIAAEVVVELMAKDRSTRRFVAEAHKRIDLYFEGPLVAIVLLTGSVLLYRSWPSATPLLLLKVAAGLIAVVLERRLHPLGAAVAPAPKIEGEFSRLAKKVSWTGYTIPFGVLAPRHRPSTACAERGGGVPAPALAAPTISARERGRALQAERQCRLARVRAADERAVLVAHRADRAQDVVAVVVATHLIAVHGELVRDRVMQSFPRAR